MKHDVISIGELIIDFSPVSVDEAGYPTIAAKAGGAPGIFCSTLAKFGAKAYIYAKVGDDTFGELLINTLKTAGVNVSGIVKDPYVFTTLAFVAIDKTGNRSFSFSRKPGADTCLRLSEIDLSQIDNAKYFHFDSLPMTHNPCKEATMRAVEYAVRMGVCVLYDPNYRPPLWESEDDARRAMEWGIERADIVKICDEEIEFLWGVDPLEGAERLIDEYGTRLVMLTCGAGGAYLINRSGRAYAACPAVKPVDTTGAGDIFAGSSVHKMLELGVAPEGLTEMEMKDIAQFAVTAASLSTQTKGGIPSIPELAEVLKFLKG